MSLRHRERHRPGRRLARASGAVSLATGILGLAGLYLGISTLGSFVPGTMAVKANTALSAILGGLSLLLAADRDPVDSRGGNIGRIAIDIFAIAILAVGVLTFIEGIVDLDIGFDQFLFIELPESIIGGTKPGRMSLLPSAAFAAVGLGLLLLDSKRFPSFSAFAGAFSAASAYLSLASHVFAVHVYGRAGSWAEMSVPATIALLGLGVGLGAATADRRPSSALVGDGSGAQLLRKTIVMVFAVPLAIDGFHVYAVEEGIFDHRFGGAISSLGIGFVLMVTLYSVAKTLDRGDQRTREAYEKLEARVIERTADLASLTTHLEERVTERTVQLEAEIEERKEIEEELRKVTRAVEQSPVAVIITDGHGAIEYANAKFCSMTGYALEEVMGRNPRILNSGIQPKSVYENLWRTILDGREWHGVFRNRRKDGSLYWASASISPIRGVAGKVEHFVGMTEDVSALKSAEESLRTERNLLRTLIDAVPDSIIVKDFSGKVLLANLEAARFFGAATPAELVGQRNTEYLPEDSRDKAVEEDRAIIESGRPVYREVIRFMDGGEGRRYSITKLPVAGSSEKSSMIVVLSRDITLAKTVEESLKRARLAAEKAKEEAESMNAAKSEFLANMSHEIRTPMNAIIGMTQLMRTTPLSDRQLEIVSRIGSSADLLLETINDILDISKIESGKMALETTVFRLSEVMSKVELVLSQKIAEKGLDFSMRVSDSIPDLLEGDPLRLRQILLNLAGNAVKFTNSGFIKIEAKPESTSESSIMIRFTVRDSGIGISTEQMSRLFTPFSQADSSTTRRYGGTGLGLAIAKSLVQVMGGEIGVRSEPGKGSAFSFTVRLGLAPREAFVGPATQEGRELRGFADEVTPLGGDELLPDPSHLSGIRILLVEDNRLNVLVAREMLTAAGAEVVVAADGDEALRNARERDFDIVLMDVQMPGISGYDATRRMHVMEGKEDLPIIAVTANAMAQDRERAAEAGMCGYVPKPFRYVDLVRAISRCVHKNDEVPQSLLAAFATGAIDGDREEVGGLEPMDGVDLRSGMERSMGKPELFLRMLRLFRTDLEGIVERLSAPGACSDLIDTGKLSHSLKGGAGSVGAASLQEAAARLEDLCRSGDSREIETARIALIHEAERILASTAVLLAKPQDEGGPPVREGSPTLGEPIAPELLLDLAAGLDEGSADALERLLGLLPDLRGETVDPRTLAELKLRAESFELESAAALLRTMAKHFGHGPSG